ncbi:hypothetical protein FNH05_28950 [Amycolatopsis rhizosphaerae]|uniref:Transmembrane protein n=1 Tax=Amycolatopsis rhizosphaerae TaxID=2053003 RepID=A0A558B299_9PSEU|nr:hypothetical protein [Amycolatopsis rhizosphaerae]TVT30636.1 hypothetical protein FNH05_28950 [Amycolatopsis rhizosphaerae]
MSGIRWWRLPHVGGNPLVRTADRVESGLLLVVVALALLAVPVAASLGSDSYGRQKLTAEAESATRQPATAVLLSDAPAETVGPHGVPVSTTVAVPASWRVAGGGRSGMVTAPRGTPAGTIVPIWLDTRGTPTAPPAPPEAAVMTGIATGVLTWTAFAAGLAMVFGALRRLLDRGRYARWEREWARLDHRSYS